MNGNQNFEKIKKDLGELIDNSNLKPFLFRTRLERTLIKTMKYSECIDNNLFCFANRCLNKLKNICDKSNMTSDGRLRSYCLLYDDLTKIYSLL